MATSAADLGRKFKAASTAGPVVLKGTIGEVAQRTKKIYIAGAATAGLTPGKRMNVGKKGTKWGVGYEFFGTGADLSVNVKYKGPVHLVNNDTAPHIIESKAARAMRREQARAFVMFTTGKKVRRARARKPGEEALRLPLGYRPEVRHPGTKGKNFFRPADDFARREAVRMVAAARRQMLLRGGFVEGG